MMRISLVILVSLLLAAAAAGAERVGFREDFSTAEGWDVSKWPGITGMESITSDGRQSTFTTLAGTFMTGASAAWAPSWPDWDKNAPAGLAIIVKKYAVVVDLDQYHYLVARIGDTDVYVALTRWPEAPRNLTLRRDGPSVRLRWEPPPAAQRF